jgi:hypothetical protein
VPQVKMKAMVRAVLCCVVAKTRIWVRCFAAIG